MTSNRFVAVTAFVLGIAAVATTVRGQQPRFDLVVRNDLFAGFGGDVEAFKRGMATCERILFHNPDHAEALAWHGSGTVFLSGRAFRDGDRARGMELFRQGLAEMDRAVSLDPNDVAVRIPRGTTLREVTRNVPAEVAAPLLEVARSDLQFTFDQQKPTLHRMPKPHPLGELLQALGDIYSRQNNPDEAAVYWSMIPTHLPDTEYAQRAAQWLRTRKPLSAAQSGCIGCHAGR